MDRIMEQSVDTCMHHVCGQKTKHIYKSAQCFWLEEDINYKKRTLILFVSKFFPAYNLIKRIYKIDNICVHI